MPVEIWSADITVKTDEGTRIFTEEVIKKIPHFLLINDAVFIRKIRMKYSDAQKNDTLFKKGITVKIQYNKQIGIVNQIIEEDPWN